MMFFNPLFLQVINNQESLSAPKAQKLNGASYLFSDIIKVCFDKNEAENIKAGNEQAGADLLNPASNELNTVDSSNSLQSNQQASSAEMTLLNLMQNILPQKFSLSSEVNDNSSQNTGSLLLNETEVTSLISKLLDSNFQGKVNILSNKYELKSTNNKSLTSAGDSNLSPENLLELLKQGNAIALDNSGSENNPGLLISLVEVKDKYNFAEAAPDKSLKDTLKNSSSDELKNESSVTKSNTGTESLAISDKDAASMIVQDNSAISQDNNAFYQVELSIIKSSNNPDLKITQDNYTLPNTYELQELVKSKGIKLPDSDHSQNGLPVTEKQYSNYFTFVSDDQKVTKNLTGTATDIIQDNALKQAKGLNNEIVNSQNALINNNGDFSEQIKETAEKTNSPEKNISKEIPQTGMKNFEGAFKIPQESLSENKSDVQNIAKPQNLSARQNTISEDRLDEQKLFAALNKSSLNINSTDQDVKKANSLQDQKNVLTSSEIPQFIKENAVISENNEVKLQDKTLSEKPVIENQNISKEAEQSSISFESTDIEEGSHKENEILKDSLRKDALNTLNPANKNEVNTAPGRKSGIIKDLHLSIKSSKLQGPEKEVSDQNSDLQTADIQKNRISEKNEMSGTTRVSQSAADKPAAKMTIEKEDAGSITEKAYMKQVADISNSAKEKEISIIGPDKGESKPETVNNSGKSELSKDSNQADRDFNHSSQEQQSQNAAQDKTEFKSKIQENHVANNINTRNDNSINERIINEPKSSPNPVRTVKAAEIMKEISGFIQQNSDHTLTLKIDPENMGTVKIALDVVDKMIHANIEVENDAARKMVETNLNQLYNSLNQNGVQINSLNISLANYDQKQSKGSSPKRKIFQTNEEADYDDKNVSESRKMGYNTYEYLI